MNPLTNVRNITKLSEQELTKGWKTSWHDQYKDSAWIFIGGLPFDLSEGDIITVFSQYGEIATVNLVRDKETGKSRGFCFLCYEDQRSTILAVDNFNSMKLLKRTIRVDHVADYKLPKSPKRKENVPDVAESVQQTPEPEPLPKPEESPAEKLKKPKKESYSGERKKRCKKRHQTSSSSSSSSSSSDSEKSVKPKKKTSKTKKRKRQSSESSSSDSDSEASKPVRDTKHKEEQRKVMSDKGKYFDAGRSSKHDSKERATEERRRDRSFEGNRRDRRRSPSPSETRRNRRQSRSPRSERRPTDYRRRE